MINIRGVTGKIAVFGVALAALLAVLSMPGSDPTQAAGTATLTVSPATQVVAPLGTFNVTIVQNANVTSTSAQASLDFDQSLFEVLDVTTAGTAYAAEGSTVAGEADSESAPPFPLGFGAAETAGAECADGVDNAPTDGRINDGCAVAGTAETGPACAGSADDDADGRPNDGCAAVGPTEKQQCSGAVDDDGDSAINDGCAAVGSPAEAGYQCQPLNSIDDDVDGVVNDGCLAKGGPEAEDQCLNAIDDDGDATINDGCPSNGVPGESGTQCGTNTIDHDFDGTVNDGCPVGGIAESGGQCGDAVDASEDGGLDAVNDGCPEVGTQSELGSECLNAANDGEADGVVNDGCPPTGTVEVTCADAVDSDGDTLVNDGCPSVGVANETSCNNGVDNDGDGLRDDGCAQVGGGENLTPCLDAIDGDAGGAEDVGPDGFINDGCPRVGSASESGGGCASGDTVDNDSDNRVNDGCPAVSISEAIYRCTDASDSDSDINVNDGCPGPVAETACGADAVDNDGDGTTNDGCPAVGLAEFAQCANDVDDDVDGSVNDGCGTAGNAEVGAQCENAANDDVTDDALINDGCPRAGGSETGGQCSNITDDDGDSLVNDGCPEDALDCGDNSDSDGDLVVDDGCYLPSEAGINCDDWDDDDGDGRKNDGCIATEPGAIAKANDAVDGGTLAQAASVLDFGDTPIATGAQNAIVISMRAKNVPCGATQLKLTNAEMLDASFEPLTTVTAVHGFVGIDDGIGASDLDCDGVLDGPDSCDFTVDATNADRNFTDLSPPKAYDDLTWPNADCFGNPFDDDDDNDGRTDAQEAAGCGAFAATNPLVRDSDGDRVLDGAECTFGTDPNDSLVKPSAATCGVVADTDLDGIQTRVEVCNYNTDPGVQNTDGDICHDGKEVASINADNTVNATDLSQTAQSFGNSTQPQYLVNMDTNKDGVINAIDLSFIAQRFGGC